jgi:hypothetical protein
MSRINRGETVTGPRPRRGGREGGAHRGRRFCGGARADGEKTLVRGRGSGRGSRRIGQGGAPSRRGICCGVSGVGEQSEKAVVGEVLAEEDDGGEIPWPGFVSRRYGKALGAGGARR